MLGKPELGKLSCVSESRLWYGPTAKNRESKEQREIKGTGLKHADGMGIL